MPKIVYQQTISPDGNLKWSALNRVIASADQLADAFEIARKSATLLLKGPRLGRVSPGVKNELLGLYNKLVGDGRYVSQLATHPAEVARKLDIRISDDALYVMSTVGSRLLEDFGAVVPGLRKKLSGPHHEEGGGGGEGGGG